MILDRHPDAARDPRRAIGYWMIPLDEEALAFQRDLAARAVEDPPGSDCWTVTFRTRGGSTLRQAGGHPQHDVDRMLADAALPDPRDYVDETWDVHEREAVLGYLDGAATAHRWMGFSNCRFCGKINGTTCFGDSEFVWPEGFAHYLREHGVRPPAAFVEHVMGQLGKAV
jgi:hypothetical protein